MIYEIINPSDAYTMASDNPAAACAACMLLGNGAYGLNDSDGEPCAPILLFGGDPDESMKAIHGVTFAETIENCLLSIRDAMASVMIGNVASRADLESVLERLSPDDREATLAERHDRRRTSMNDIGAAAAQWVKRLDAKIIEQAVEAAP